MPLTYDELARAHGFLLSAARSNTPRRARAVARDLARANAYEDHHALHGEYPDADEDHRARLASTFSLRVLALSHPRLADDLDAPPTWPELAQRMGVTVDIARLHARDIATEISAHGQAGHEDSVARLRLEYWLARRDGGA